MVHALAHVLSTHMEIRGLTFLRLVASLAKLESERVIVLSRQSKPLSFLIKVHLQEGE